MKYLIILIVLFFSITLSGCEEPEDPSIAPWEKGMDINYTPYETKFNSSEFNSDGGVLELNNNDINLDPTKLVIEEGTLFDKYKFEIKRKSNKDVILKNYNSINSMMLLSPIYEFTTTADKLDKPVTIEIPFENFKIPYKENETEYKLSEISNDMSSYNPELIYYDNDIWNKVENTKIKGNLIIAKIDHFTPFVIRYPKWPNYGKNEFKIENFNIAKINKKLTINCNINAMGKYPFKSFNRFSNFNYAEFELITFIKLMKKENNINKLVLEKQYHNVILINKYDSYDIKFNKDAYFSSYSFNNSANSAWFGYNGFFKPTLSETNPFGVHRYLATIIFDENRKMLNEPLFKKVELENSVIYSENILKGNFNEKLFSIKDEFIDIDELSENSNYYFDILSCWVNAADNKKIYFTSKENYFKTTELTYLNKEIKVKNISKDISLKPENLIATNISEHKFTLSWAPVLNAYGYYIYLNDLKYWDSVNENIEITGLNGSTEYSVSVEALVNNEKKMSNKLKVTTSRSNNIPTISNITAKNGSSDIEISYYLADNDNDTCSVELYYSIDTGIEWNKLTKFSGLISEISPNRTQYISWNTLEDIKGIEDNVLIKIIPNDGKDSGDEKISNSFSINIPTISDISLSNNSDDIFISYIISNNCDKIIFEYSKDNGTNWLTSNYLNGTVENLTSGINSIIWNSQNDIYDDINNIKIKISPYYNNNTKGNYDETESFSLLNKNSVVKFNDLNFESAIRIALSKPTGDITNSDLSTLTSLTISNQNITDISELSHCINISNIDLSQNNIYDISAFKYLKNLTYIDLSNNKISDITTLVNNSSLISGTSIILSGNSLNDTVDQNNMNILKNRGLTIVY